MSKRTIGHVSKLGNLSRFETVETVLIDDDAITTAKILDANVTRAKLEADIIDGTKIEDDAVDSEHYAAGSIDTEHIADLQVTRGKIALDAIDGTLIADDQVNSEHYVAGSIDEEHIASSAVTNDKLGPDAVDGTKIADLAVNTEHIAAFAVEAGQIGPDAVNSTKIGDNVIGIEHMQNASVDTAELVADAVDGTRIADLAVDTEHLAGSAVETAKINDDAVTTAKILDANVTVAKLASNIGTFKRNFLDNAQFLVQQRGQTAFTLATDVTNADLQGVWDRWRIISETAIDGVDLDLVDDSTTGMAAASLTAKLIATTAGVDTKFGIMQILSNETTRLLRGNNVTLSCWVKVNSAISNFDMAIVKWTGATDDLSGTPDPITAWNATAAEPSWAAGYAKEVWASKDSGDGLTTTFTQQSVTAAIDANAENLAILLYQGDSTGVPVANACHIALPQLELASEPSEFDYRSHGEEIDECKRYYQRLMPKGNQEMMIGSGTLEGAYGTNNVSTSYFWHLDTEMASLPTYASSAVDTFNFEDVGTSTMRAFAALTLGANYRSRVGITMHFTITVTQANNARGLFRDGTDTTYIEADAEL